MCPIRMEKVESALRLALAFKDALNRHDVEGMMRLMTDDCIFENTYPPPEGTRYIGKEAVTQFWKAFFKNSPHARIEVEEVYNMGHHCVMRWRYHWVDASGAPGYIRG